MKGADALITGGKKLAAAVGKYKFVLLIICVGAVLLLIPTGKAAQTAKTEVETEDDFSVAQLEEKLETVLSRIDGAGKASVVLTVKGGARQILAQDETSSKGENVSEEQTSAVIVSTGSGTQQAVALQRLYPQFQGALVVCPGGGDPAIRLKIMEAVSALTGLGSDKISVCKGK